jgi:hypothetical protein
MTPADLVKTTRTHMTPREQGENLFASPRPVVGLDEAVARLSKMTGVPVPRERLLSACQSGAVAATKTLNGWTLERERLPAIALLLKR